MFGKAASILSMSVGALVIALGVSGPARAASGAEVFNVVAPFEVKGMEPSTAGDVFLRTGVAETLVDVDENGKPLPALAERWEVSDDGKVWRFFVRPGVVFHDGSKLTAESIAHALNVALARSGGLLAKAPIESIAPEGETVVVTLKQPFAPLLAFLAHNTTQILAPASYAADDTVVKVIGTGPFSLGAFEPPLKFSVERFDGYWGEKPAIAKANYLAAGRGETRALLAESGDADYVLNLDPASRVRLEKGDKVDVLSIAIPRTVLLKVNAGHPALKDVATRQALSAAIDREGIATAILRLPDAGATQLFPPSVGTWHNKSIAPLAYDVDKAKALLAEAGWTPGNDGVLERDGTRFTVTLTTYPDRPELPLIAAALQEQLREVGIAATINSTNSSEIPAKHQDGTLELGLVARNFALVPDPIGTILQDYPPQGGDWGALNWSNAEFNAAIDALSRTADADEGQALRDKAVSILQAELPVIPVAWYQQTAAVSKKVEGARLDPFERSFGLAKVRKAP